jgi:ABC-2 type transport system ATP-binding protein
MHPMPSTLQSPSPGNATPHHRDAAISVIDLSKSYGDRPVLDGVTFHVPKGAITGFIGPNGAGKTTTIRALLGFVQSSGGTATVLGESIDQPERFLGRVGALIDSPAFYPGLSARQNLRMLTDIGNIPSSRIDVVLDIVGLTARADDPAKQYSLGMRQRLGIAAALLPDPELLILDEPTNGLDPVGIQEIRTLLRRLADEGRSVLVSSHLLAELEQVADWIVVLLVGKVVYQGTVDNLPTKATKLRMTSGRAEDVATLEAICADLGIPARRDDIYVEADASGAVAGEINQAAMDRGVTLIEIQPQRPTLEDAFFGLLQGPQLK